MSEYDSLVNVIFGCWEKYSAEEFEELQESDELYDLQTLMQRNAIDVLMPLLAKSKEKAVLEKKVAQTDATLRRYGVDILGPLFRMGTIQRVRATGFEPREKWWWYLDEM